MAEAILMSTPNIYFFGELSKLIQLSARSVAISLGNQEAPQ